MSEAKKTSDYEVRTTGLTVVPRGDHLFSELATVIELKDEAAGEFVTLTQCRDNASAEIQIDRAEWPKIKEAVDTLLSAARGIRA